MGSNFSFSTTELILISLLTLIIIVGWVVYLIRIKNQSTADIENEIEPNNAIELRDDDIL
jgi:uncharacterized membrane protein